MAQKVSDSNFATVIAENHAVMVDFWATWCGPCRMIAPIVDELSEEYAGKVFIGKCDVDDNTDAPMKYSIRNIPTLLFFKDGELVDRLVGAVSKAEIAAKLDSIQ